MADLRKLTILHSNDMHGDFLAEAVDDALVGGASMLSGYIGRVRAEEENTLYLVAGDMFRGSVIDSEYRGVSTIEIMNLLMPDAVCVGNHEVDYGLAHLLFMEKCARFPIINANMYVVTNHARLFRSHIVREIGGLRVLLIGILTEDVLMQTRQESLIGSMVDVREAAAEVGRIIGSYKHVDVDLTVLLTHIGFEEDKRLAAMLDPAWGVDIIIGGHSHTVPDAPAEVNGALIVQAGTGTDQIGRFDLCVDRDTNAIASWDWRIVPIDAAHCPRDSAMEELITGYHTETERKYGRIVTRFARRLTNPGRTEETELGNLFADALRESFGVDIMLLGAGSIRVDALGPVVTYRDYIRAFPFDDSAHLLCASGAELTDMFAYMLKKGTGASRAEFYQVSRGVRIRYSPAEQAILRFTLNGEEIEPARVYRLCLQRFHFSNLERIFGVTADALEQNGRARVLASSCRDVLEDYLTDHPLLTAAVEGRIELV